MEGGTPLAQRQQFPWRLLPFRAESSFPHFARGEVTGSTQPFVFSVIQTAKIVEKIRIFHDTIPVRPFHLLEATGRLQTLPLPINFNSRMLPWRKEPIKCIIAFVYLDVRPFQQYLTSIRWFECFLMIIWLCKLETHPSSETISVSHGAWNLSMQGL